MKNCVTRYKKILKRNLYCSGNTRKRLLQKFEIALSAFLEDNPTPSMDELSAAFGPPKEMASVLMEEVPKQEVARYRARNIWLWCILGCIGACVLVWCILLGIEILEVKNGGYIHENEASIIDETPTDDSIYVEDEIIVID